MLRPVGEPRRIDRAIRRLQGALKGVPTRGVRLTWRGGELRTTIHWARDDSFWWAFEPRTARQALLLGHAPDAPTKRESITCEINLPRAGADRKVAGIIAADDAGALYLAHSGRMGGTRLGQRKSGFRDFLADGVWRRLTWPDGDRQAAHRQHLTHTGCGLYQGRPVMKFIFLLIGHGHRALRHDAQTSRGRGDAPPGAIDMIGQRGGAKELAPHVI